MRIPRFLVLLSLATLILCAASFADTAYNLASLGVGDLGVSTATITVGSNSITFYGFSKEISGGPADTHLWGKPGPPTDEAGLGLANDLTDHEIVGGSFIQFTALGTTSVTIGSVQGGEQFQLFGSNTLGTLGTLLTGYDGTIDENKVSLPPIDGSWKYVSVFAKSGNVLLEGAGFAPAVPEPGTTAMILTLGLVGLFEVGRRKLRA